MRVSIGGGRPPGTALFTCKMLIPVTCADPTELGEMDTALPPLAVAELLLIAPPLFKDSSFCPVVSPETETLSPPRP